MTLYSIFSGFWVFPNSFRFTKRRVGIWGSFGFRVSIRKRGKVFWELNSILSRYNLVFTSGLCDLEREFTKMANRFGWKLSRLFDSSRYEPTSNLT